MRVYPNQLNSHLNTLKSVYLVFGDDPWLTDNSKQQIITAAKSQGFDERITLDTQDSGFQWHQLEQECQAMSLFASRRIIELHLANAKPGSEGGKLLQQLLTHPNPDNLLLITGPKLGLDQTKTKWFKTLDNQGLYVPCATPEGPQFQKWLLARIRQLNLKLNRDAEAMLCNLYEGNLLAADQALKLLKLLAQDSTVSVEQLTEYFEDQSRFSVFQLTDCLLENHKSRGLHMLAQLKAEGTALPILMWSLLKELTTLFKLKSAQEQGQSLNPIWSSLRIWDKRKPLYQSALNRLNLLQIEHMLAVAATLEIQLKQQGIENWVGLSHLCLLFDPLAHRQLAHIEVQ